LERGGRAATKEDFFVAEEARENETRHDGAEEEEQMSFTTPNGVLEGSWDPAYWQSLTATAAKREARSRNEAARKKREADAKADATRKAELERQGRLARMPEACTRRASAGKVLDFRRGAQATSPSPEDPHGWRRAFATAAGRRRR